VKDNSFLTLVLDQLHDFGEVYARVMFGGHGLYRNRVFFATMGASTSRPTIAREAVILNLA
jgi:TfoX/Sxy family transcriptional regulator of competence genes